MLNGKLDNRYRIVQLIDSNRLVDRYKALDEKTGGFVGITILKEDTKKISLPLQLYYKKEIEVISKIVHGNVLKIYSLGEYENRYYVVTDFFEGHALCRYLTRLQEIDQAVEIVLLISSGLEQCHSEGVIHKCINPYAILIAQRGNEIRLRNEQDVKVDGLCYSSLIDLTAITEKKEIENIFGYMSPEVSGILRASIDSRADIYSLGILFYKLISGELPYTGNDISTLIHQHIAQSPKSPSIFNKSVPEILDRIVLRMIAKNPHDRYQGLSALIADLKEYQNQRRQGNQVIDFVIARQDRLRKIDYSTLIVGRNKELNRFTSYIKQTKESKGHLFFISGEAGVGKTRLVDEAVKWIHEVKGIVLKGKCDQYDFQTPYKIFHEIIASYLKKLERKSIKEQDQLIAKIKKSVGELAGEVVKIAPEISRLLGEPNKLVELEAEKEQTRFLITIINFLLSFGSPGIPVIMFLDDLQWADESSIELLERMARQVHMYSILIIGAFRDREISADHRLWQTIEKLKEEKIPFHEIHLNRLSLMDTKEIVGHILLEDEKHISALAEDLYEKAKGNPFFLVELLHSLVEEGVVCLKDDHFQYDASRDMVATIPSNIVDVILKRVRELSDQDSGILSCAAVMGRKIEFELLRKISFFSSQGVLSAIEEGMRRQLVSGNIMGKGDFSFTHDRIREAFYRKLPEDERISLHKEIGSFLEEQNRDNLEPVLFELAYHFTQAKMEDKTLQYSAQAAKKAQSAYAYDQAIRLYEVTRGILHKQNKIGSTIYIDILMNLGVAYYQKGRYKEALHTLKVCESRIPQEEKLKKAEVLSNIGDVLQKKGELRKCEQVLVRAVKILGIRLPQNSITVSLSIIMQFFIHVFHSLLPRIFVRKECSHDRRVEIVSHLLYRLFYLYYFTDLYKSVCVLLRSQNFAEKHLGPSRKLSQIYALAGMLWMQIGCPWWARRNSRLAEKIAKDLNDKASIGLAKAFYAWVEHPYRTLESIHLADKAVELLMAVGEYWDLGHAWCCFLWGKQKVGKNLKELLDENKKQIIIMQSINAMQNLGWTLGIKGMFLIYIGDERLKSEGIKTLMESRKMLEEVNDKPWFLCATGYLAYAHLRIGNYEEAIGLADNVSKLFLSYHNLTTWLLDIVGMCAQVYLYSIMNKPNLSEAERKKYFKKAKYFCRLAHFKGWMYPTYKGWAYLVNGTYQWLCGKKRKALDTWDQGIAYLRNQGRDTYRLASILLEEASFLIKEGSNVKKVHEYLLEAKEIFTNLGAKLDLDRTVRLLEIVSPGRETVEDNQALTLTRHLTSLLKVTKAIGSLLKLEDLLETIVNQAMEVTGAKRGFLLLYDEEMGALQHKVSKGLDEEQSFGTAFSFGEYRISLALVREVERSHEGLIGDQNHTLFPEIASELKEYCIREALCVPLKAKEKFLGVIYLDTCMTEGIFGQNELDLMNSFAIQASISIENAYLVKNLIDHERSLQEMIERAPDAVVVYDMTGKIINVNCQTCETLGYSSDELLNITISDIQENHAHEKISPLVDRLEQGPMTMPGVYRRKDGSNFPVEERLSIINYRGHKVVLCLARDITIRKKMENELQKMQRLESLGVLAGGIAHDFNNLLTTIIGNLSLVELYAESGENIFELLKEIKTASQQSKRLTQQLLAFSKGGEPLKKTVSVAKLLKDTAHLTLSGSNVKCRMTLPDDLWWANIDEGQINQVVNNLMINAQQAMVGGGVISVCAENVSIGNDNILVKEGKYVKISIKDQGIGISEEHLQKIFDPYFTTKQKGSGIGLAISYSIIKKHDGHIIAESEMGKGTTFTMYLPAAEKEIFQLKKIEEETILRSRGKILFMDDQVSIRNMMGNMLAHLGYDIAYAKDGLEAVKLYKKEKESGKCFDAVILDLTIPGNMGGEETIKKLHKIDPEVKAIISSGYINNSVLAHYERFGFTGVVSKPYEVKELSKVLHEVLQKK